MGAKVSSCLESQLDLVLDLITTQMVVHGNHSVLQLRISRGDCDLKGSRPMLTSALQYDRRTLSEVVVERLGKV